MEPPRPMQRHKKARKWLRTREVERLRVLNLELDIHALRSEIRTLQVTRSLLVARRKRQGDLATLDDPCPVERTQALKLKTAGNHFQALEDGPVARGCHLRYPHRELSALLNPIL